MRRHLVLFLRAPAFGRGKRRLARDIGALAALSFQRQRLAALLPLLADPRWRAVVAITPDAAVHRPPPALRRFARMGQGRGDLGARMARPFRRLPPGPVVLVGSDIPDLTAATVWAGFRALGHHDAVFGPATDGGFWLVGLGARQRRATPFKGVAWSTERALGDTLAQLRGARVALLPPLADIDTGADYRAWRQRAG